MAAPGGAAGWRFGGTLAEARILAMDSQTTIVEQSRSSSGSVTSLARGAGLNGVAFGVGSLAGFAAMILVGRSLGPAVVGRYFQVVAIVSIACSVATCGAEPGVIRTLSRLRALDMPDSVRPVVLVATLPVLVTSIVICMFIELLAPDFARSFASGSGEGATLIALRVVALSIPFWAVGRVFTAASRGLGSNTATAILDGFLQQTSRLALVGALAVLAPTLVSFTVAWTVPVIFISAMAGAWLIRLLRGMTGKGRGQLAVGRQNLADVAREFWGFAWARGVAYVFQVSTLWIGILMTGALASSSAAGIFGSLSRVAIVGTLALQSINLVLEPRLAGALARNDRQAAQRLFQVATGWAVIVGFPLFTLAAVFSPMLLRLFGSGYSGGALALAVVSGAMLWNIATGPVTAVLLMAGKSTWNLWNTAAAFVTYVVLGFALIPAIGLPGAALAWAAAIGVENGLPLLEVRLGLDLHPFSAPALRVMVVSVAVFGVAGIAARAIGLDDLPGALLAAITASGVYLRYLRDHAAELELPILRRPLGRARLPLLRQVGAALSSGRRR